MKQVVKSIVVMGAIAASSSAFGFFDDFSPYIGLDYQQVWLNRHNHNSGFGNFSKSFPGTDLYIGGRFCENWGLEFGWDWAAKRSRSFTIPANTTFNGSTLTAAHNVNTHVRLNGLHLDLMGYLPLICDCLDLIGSAGIGWLHPRVHVYDTTSGTSNADNVLQSGLNSISGRSRAYWRLRAGLGYMFTECVGIRGLVGWQATSHRFEGNSNFSGGTFGRGFRNSWSLAAGVFVKF